jgi:HSP20 family protein
MVPWKRRLPWPMEGFDTGLAEVMERFLNPAEDWNEQEKFAPMANVAETETRYEVTLELPGMKPEELNVEFRNGELWVTGERKEEKEAKGKTFHRIERRHGEFKRGFALPAAINEEKVAAEYKDGILRITVPKVEAAMPKRVAVKT